jgi:phosphatidate cytidylyltransferase
MKRVLTALVLIPFILYVVYLGPFWLLFGVTALVALICYSEYSAIAAGYGVGKLGPVGYAAGILVLLARPQDGYVVFTLLTLIGLALALRQPDPSKALPYAAALAFGIVYIFGSWKFAILLRSESVHWLGYGLILNWIGDTCAYFVGRAIGKHKMAPVVSPNKSWEGAMSSLVASLIFGVIYLNRAVPAVSPLQAGIVSVAANVAGQIGDFAESVLKRGAGLKDSSTLLPGHGGLLDRVDSSLFALPVVYLNLYLNSPH